MIVTLGSIDILTCCVQQKEQYCEIGGFIQTRQQGGNLFHSQVRLVWELVILVEPELVELPLLFFKFHFPFITLPHCSRLNKTYTVNVLNKLIIIIDVPILQSSADILCSKLNTYCFTNEP